MRFRLPFFGVALLALAIFYAGCSNNEGGSFSSAWTGLSAKGGTVETTEVATQTAEVKISVLPAQLTVANEGKIPVSVTVAGSGTTDLELSVAMSSTLGGSFSPESGTFENGQFMTSFTAPSTITGTTEIVALSGSVIGTAAVQITAKVVEKVIPSIAIIPALNPAVNGTDQFISVKITDAKDKPLEDIKTMIYSSAGGTFKTSSEQTDATGFAYFEYTAPAPKPLAGVDKITVQALGVTATSSIVIQ